jgi:hypothetical protein
MMKRSLLAGVALLAGICVANAQSTQLSPNTTTFTQTTTATMGAIPANPTRRQIQICGQTATNTLNVTFGTGVTPTSSLGIPIAAQSCVLFTPPTGSFLGSQINLIAVTGSVTVLVTEYF